MIWFFGGAGLLLAAAFAAHWWWARRVRAEIAEGAAVEWERLSANDPEVLEGIDRARFEAIYARTHFPRFPAYALAAAASFVAALPLVFGVLAGAIYAAERTGVLPAPVSVADRYLIDGDRMRIVNAAPPEAAYYWVQDLGGFYYFFGVVFAWMAIVWFFVRRYHARRPGYLRDELLRARR